MFINFVFLATFSAFKAFANLLYFLKQKSKNNE